MLVTPVVPQNFVHPGLSLEQIFSIVKGYRKQSLLIVLMVLSLTVLMIKIIPRSYTATTTLMVNYEVNDPLNGKVLPVGQLGSYIATQVELMQAPEVLLAVVDRLKLTQDEDYANGYSGDSGTLREWVAKKLNKNLAAYQGQQGSQLIYLTYSANNPADAALIANTVAEVYKEQDYMRSTGPPGERAERYAQQLNELKQKVDQAQQKVTQFHQRNGLIDGGNNGDEVLLATLEDRLLEARNARRVAAARASGDQSVNDQVLSSNFIQLLKTQLATQQSRLAQLNITYAPRHPEVQELQSQIDATQRSLDAALETYTANASVGLSTARHLEQNLQQAVSEQRTKVLDKGKLHHEAAKILLELESIKAVYKRALDGYDQIMFASTGHDSNVSFVSRATPPVKDSKPKKILMLGVFAAGVLGLGIPLGYELFDRRVRCRDDLERHLGIPVLAEFGGLPVRTAA
jgi:uncharacterized protein involved in exopolysaccharide biosynthesis